ncbi:DeoR/GlpR family DNA-binding transcription regulator [Umezawaea sp. Da 62-37]|uniref:DeoR/GlpR family DNA-binding transcription regulator n=1 Tax=Umezawaea sp. Da 62-37 TaxID=3075927 RepID=UPI0028F71EFE|nr:DeoR/GlpR family DNA-binding transcription regulator [Umezawaea sp. Da 62-37]WNV84307.1 DeoR/GlpR family DNA-binding transcription regulator [Umezawaea sp. Da 62-37]
MDGAKRHELILQSLRQGERVAVGELAELTGCSEMTIRRDLDTLEREGLLRRVRGAAVGMLTGEEVPYAARGKQRIEAKRRIALAVAELIDDGESIVVDGGSTTLEAAKLLTERRLTVLPLSLHVANALRGAERVRLVLPGGDLRPGELSFVGPLTEYAFQVMRFDTMVLGSCGLSVRNGVSSHDLQEGAVKKAAVTASARVIAAVDGSKFGRTAFGRVCGIEAIDVLVTDEDAPADEIAAVRDAGVEVRLV